MHRISVDRAHAMVCMTASGYFSVEATEAAAADLHSAIRSLGSRAGEHVTLYDYTDVAVVSPAVLERFAQYFTAPEMRPLLARKVAFVSGSTLLTMQIQRIQRDNMRLFATRGEAAAWLLAGQERERTISQPTAASG